MAGWSKCLAKSQLGGVIFGCTNSTMDECLTKQLFGLPGQHISYVKNIDPGLPLFLFNYSERKLYGIYEASCSGQMNIDPSAWTGGGSGKTKFPAQVQIRVRSKCQALVENQFKPIIATNYYKHNHFHFELDHAQTSMLISALSPVAVGPTPITFTPKKTQKWMTVTKTSPPNEKGEEIGASKPLRLTEDFGCLDGSKNQLKESSSSSDQNHENLPYDEKDLLYMKLKELSLSDEFSRGDMIGDVVEASSKDNADVESEKLDDVTTNLEKSKDEIAFTSSKDNADVESEKLDDVSTNLGKSKDEIAFTSSKDNADVESGKLDDATANLGKSKDESAFTSLDYTAIISQLRGEIDELKAFKQQQALKMEKIEMKLFDAERKIDGLEKRCVIPGNEALVGSNGIPLDLNDSIFIVGGYDGVSWSAALDSFSPSRDVLRSRKPMSAARAHTSVAKLCGELYVVGGGINSTWYDTVESYNAVDDQWTTRPSLNAKKGCLASAALNGKLFSIGGGNGMESTSDVEILDPGAGRWVSSCSMLQKRFALAAVECLGALYAVGGFDGNEYLNSAERFDPRDQHGWTKISSMNTKRGGHSMVALNEKLYAIGGHDGEKMVPIVEIYEPRVGTWMTGEPMHRSRGFFAAARVKDTIYAIGGLKADSGIDETIECYKEGEGWQETKLSSVGKKCHASAIVLGDD